jgi:hypothetical protein
MGNRIIFKLRKDSYFLHHCVLSPALCQVHSRCWTKLMNIVKGKSSSSLLRARSEFSLSPPRAGRVLTV